MWKKAATIVLAAALCVSAFAGCSNGGDNPSSSAGSPSSAAGTSSTDANAPKDPATVEVWHLFAEDTEPTLPHGRMLAWAEEFNANNTDNITVKVTGGKTADVILTTIAAGDTPDVFMNYWNNASAWADKGAILDLTDYVNNDAAFDKDDIHQAAWDRATYNGRIYSIPNSFSSTFLFYRADLLRELGYDKAPETLEEMFDIIEKGTKTRDDGSIERMGMIPNYPWLDNVLWPVSFGASWIDTATNKITFDTDEMRAAYQWQADIYTKYGYDKVTAFQDGLGTRGQATDPLIEGKLLMRWNGESLVASMEEFGADVEWGVAPIPYPADKPELKGAGMVTSNVWEINAKTKNPDAAWTVLADLTGKETMKKLSEGNYNKGSFYSRKSSLEYIRDTLDVSPATKQIAEYMLSDAMTGFPMSSYINEYLNIINDEMSKALTGEQTVEQACKNVQDQVQPLADASPTTK